MRPTGCNLYLFPLSVIRMVLSSCPLCSSSLSGLWDCLVCCKCHFAIYSYLSFDKRCNIISLLSTSGVIKNRALKVMEGCSCLSSGVFRSFGVKIKLSWQKSYSESWWLLWKMPVNWKSCDDVSAPWSWAPAHRGVGASAGARWLARPRLTPFWNNSCLKT